MQALSGVTYVMSDRVRQKLHKVYWGLHKGRTYDLPGLEKGEQCGSNNQFY